MPKNQVERNKLYIQKQGIKQIKIDVKPDEYSLIDEAAKINNMGKKELIIKSIRYCIDNNIKLDRLQSIEDQREQHNNN